MDTTTEQQITEFQDRLDELKASLSRSASVEEYDKIQGDIAYVEKMILVTQNKEAAELKAQEQAATRQRILQDQYDRDKASVAALTERVLTCEQEVLDVLERLKSAVLAAMEARREYSCVADRLIELRDKHDMRAGFPKLLGRLVFEHLCRSDIRLDTAIFLIVRNWCWKLGLMNDYKRREGIKRDLVISRKVLLEETGWMCFDKDGNYIPRQGA
jgi:uncharacterized protein YdcH (DUF465 family)